ncbi:hypothetical protein [Cryptosporangium japonicum]|uniref:Uncharacterized protein n=1 Tax=Cryptosporangium japonicum TaxID=80872 RepID=A0ABN0TE43_9ACTN
MSIVFFAATALALTLVAVIGVAGLRGRAHSRVPIPAGHTTRGAILMGFATVTALGPALTELPTAVRAVPTAAVALLAPGLALLGFARIRDPFTEVVLSLAISVASLVLASQLMLLVDTWRPVALFAVTCLTAAPVLAWHGANGLDPADRAPRNRDVIV